MIRNVGILVSVLTVSVGHSFGSDDSPEAREGRVVEVDRDRGGLVVQFDGSDEAEFVKVAPGDLAIGYEGSEISGVLNRRNETARLSSVWPKGTIVSNAMAGVNRSIIREAATMGRAESLSRGDYLPDFALFNHRGEPVYARDLRNQPTVMSFIFTRCGDPVMCPATSARMAQLGDRLAEAGREDVRLVLVSFDPEYDTPGVLHQYADALGMETDQYELLTGDSETIRALLHLTGVRTIEEDGTIVHNLVTLLSDNHGRIILRQDGSRWSADAIFERLTTDRG